MTTHVDAPISYGVRPPGYRLPDETRLGRVCLQVSDLERSIAYYEQVIGFRLLGRTAAGARLGAHDDDRVLVELVEKRGVSPVPRRGRVGLYHFAILVPRREDLGRFVRHLADIGVRAGMSDHFVSEALYLQDPDNLGIEVYADRPRSQWRVRDLELAMTTEPLDVDSLVAAAGDDPWTGMPAGTVIGHVHLHVGHIDQGAAFYHDAIGFDKVVWSYPGALFLSAGGYHHHVGTNTWAGSAPPAGEDEARLLEWEIIVPSAADATRALDSASNAGHPVERSANGGVARDPWGTPVAIRAAA
jgi:catechol 2,3-dioxygenase